MMCALGRFKVSFSSQHNSHYHHHHQQQQQHHLIVLTSAHCIVNYVTTTNSWELQVKPPNPMIALLCKASHWMSLVTMEWNPIAINIFTVYWMMLVCKADWQHDNRNKWIQLIWIENPNNCQQWCNQTWEINLFCVTYLEYYWNCADAVGGGSDTATTRTLIWCSVQAEWQQIISETLSIAFVF